MRTLYIAAAAFLAFGSAAYAMNYGPYHHPLHRGHHVHSVVTAPVDNGQPAVSGFTADTTAPIARAPGWGPGDAWHNFPGSTNANGG
jgi:hypothetical protein